MINLAKAIGRVMMTAVSLPRSTTRHADVQRWVDTEYRNDPNYAYQCLIHGIKPNLH